MRASVLGAPPSLWFLPRNERRRSEQHKEKERSRGLGETEETPPSLWSLPRNERRRGATRKEKERSRGLGGDRRNPSVPVVPPSQQGVAEAPQGKRKP